MVTMKVFTLLYKSPFGNNKIINIIEDSSTISIDYLNFSFEISD